MDEVLVSLSSNTLPLLFRECLHGLYTGFTIQTMARVWVYYYQPPGLLITHPNKLIFCEAFVSQLKTLLEPKVVADGYLWIFFFLLEVDLSKIGILTCVIQNLAHCHVHYKLQFRKLPVLKFCQFVVLEDWCSLPNTGYCSGIVDV